MIPRGMGILNKTGSEIQGKQPERILLSDKSALGLKENCSSRRRYYTLGTFWSNNLRFGSFTSTVFSRIFLFSFFFYK